MNDSKPFYPTAEIRERAKGNWVAILAAMIPEIEPALKKGGRGHVACPMPGHAGKKKFRVFKDVNDTGGAICSCGSWKEGFNVLMDYHGWTFEDTKEAIGRFLQMEPVVPRQKGKSETVRRPVPVKEERQDNKGLLASLKGSSEQLSQETGETLPTQHQPEEVAPEAASVPEEKLTIEAPDMQEKTPEQAQEMDSSLAAMADAQAAEAEEQEEMMSEAEVVTASAKTIVDFCKDKPWLQATKEELEAQQKQEAIYQAGLVERIEKLWNEALPLDAPVAAPARAYMINRQLRTRGVDLTQSLRFIQKLVYRDEDGNVLGEHPAIVAAIRDVNGELITLHRTYLTAKGNKARVPSAKKMMPVPSSKQVVGGAIRLGEAPDGVIGIAEGMETALSVFRATGMPVWSLVSASVLQGFEPPEGVKTVVHWADKDRSAAGEKADAVLRERLESRGFRVVTMLPQMPIPKRAKGVDWNDVLVQQGLFGFPRRDHLQALIKGSQKEVRHVG